MTVQRQQDDGSWRPAEPMGWQGRGLDIEISSAGGRWRWALYDRADLLAHGSTRSRTLTYLVARVVRWWYGRRRGPR